MIACAPADLPKEDFSTFFQFFFYPVTITGPWITFSAFAEAKKAESFDSVSISQFTGRVARFVGYLIIGELGQVRVQHWKKIQYWKYSSKKPFSKLKKIKFTLTPRKAFLLLDMSLTWPASARNNEILESGGVCRHVRLPRNGTTLHLLQFQLRHCFAR